MPRSAPDSLDLVEESPGPHRRKLGLERGGALVTELGSAWWCWTCGWLVTSGQGSWWWIWGPSSGRSQGSLPAGSSSGDPLNPPECSPPSPPCLPSLAFHTGYPSVPGEGSPLPQPSPADRAGPRLRSSLWSPSPLHFLLCQPGGSLLGPPWHCCPTCRALGQREEGLRSTVSPERNGTSRGGRTLGRWVLGPPTRGPRWVLLSCAIWGLGSILTDSHTACSLARPQGFLQGRWGDGPRCGHTAASAFRLGESPVGQQGTLCDWLWVSPSESS